MDRKFFAMSMRVADEEEQEEQEVHPKVYVGTYGKYASGYLDGEWVDLTKFDSYEDFLKHCNEIHKDESDQELMFQDYEGFPSCYYHESSLDPELWDYMNVIKEHDKDMVDAILEDGYSLSDLEDAYYYKDCQTMGDVVAEMVSEMGFEAFSKETWENAFDYDHFGRELQWDMDDEELESYEGMSDQEIGEQYVDAIGGLEALGEETLEAYADLDSIGLALKSEGGWIETPNGFVKVMQ